MVDVLDSANRRKQITGSVKSVDVEINDSRRKSLTLTSRYVQRNFAVGAWAVRKHLDFCSSFNFQARTGDEAFDRRVEELMNWWSRPANCDAAGRHSLHKIIRLMESCRIIDGDAFLLKLTNGKIQAIEGDRVKTPREVTSLPGQDSGNIVNGVEVGRFGELRRIAVHSRGRSSGLEFERWVRAQNVFHHGWFDRFDQVRGVSPILAALNPLQDVYENFDYALAKSKVAQLFGIAFYRDAVDSVGELDAADDENDDGTTPYNVSLGTRPLVLDLEPGDKAEFLENKTPSTEFREFTQVILGVALKALDIPFSFYDEGYTNFFGSMAAQKLYLKSAEAKRNEVKELLRKLTTWRLRLFIADGVLELPPGINSIDDIRFEWIATGLPWFQPEKEIRADVMAINAGLKTRSEVRKERFGDDWRDTVRQLADEEKFIRESGASVLSPGPDIFNAGNEVDDNVDQ